MSQADVERFVADLKTNPGLLAEVKENAGGIASVVKIAKDQGYDISLEEAKAYVQDQAGSELSDEQLDAVAGGKGHHHHTTNVVNVQTAVTVTTEATTAETTTEVAAEAVAVAVIVLT